MTFRAFTLVAIAACSEAAPPPPVLANAPQTTMPPPAPRSAPPVTEQRDLRSIDLPFTVAAPIGARVDERDSGKGPTRHADLQTDALRVDLIDWPPGGLACSIDADPRDPVHADDGRRWQDGRDPSDGSVGGVLCDDTNGARCMYWGATAHDGAVALAICKSIHRIGRGSP